MSSRSEEMNLNYNSNAQHVGDNIGRDKIENYFFTDSMHLSQVKKRFTNKRLITPFTGEKANASQGGTYVPREDLLKRIDDCFKCQNGKKRMVFLTGIGGCGKSELARAYAAGHRDYYEEIFWLTCTDGFTPVLMLLFENADKLCKVELKDAASFSENVLIIVDNCNTYNEKFLFDLENATGDSDILVTTRLKHMGDYDALIPVVSEDKYAFARKVFEKNYCRRPRVGNPKKLKNIDEEFVRLICREVQYNTMIVAMIGIRLREYNDLTIPECAKKILAGVGTLNGKLRYSKDLEPHVEEIRDILVFLFSDILAYRFSDAEKAILTVLSLAPASWFEIEYIISLCRGTQPAEEYEDAVANLLDFNWLQGGEDSIAVHPLVAEVISDRKIVIRKTAFFEELLENYQGLPERYLEKNRFLINKILNFSGTGQPISRIVVMLLINHVEYKKLFEELFSEVRVALFVYVDHNRRRQFLYRDLEKEETKLLLDIPCQEQKENHVTLMKIINTGIAYKLDLNISFCGKEIEIIPEGLCCQDYNLKELSLPDKLVEIGSDAFSECIGLSGELCLPESLASIGDSAFSGCRCLSGELRLPKGVTSMGYNAFNHCSGLRGDLSLPEQLTVIRDGTFNGCSGLNGELNLPEGLTNIGSFAFMGCSGLSGELRLPKGVTNIGIYAFRSCSGLNGDLQLPEGLTVIREGAFWDCSGLNGELHLPKGLISIGDYAFFGCSGLTGALRLPEGFTSIGKCAFWGCSNLNGELYLPEEVTSIGEYAFHGCSGLTGELSLPKGLVVISKGAFWDCRGLNGELSLSKDLTSIEDSAFWGCSGLKGELHLPEGLKSIGAFAFHDCSGLSGELLLPEGVTNIGDYAFWGCRELKGELYLPKGLRHDAGKSELYDRYVVNGELHLPEDLTTIEDCAFINRNLIGELRLPKGLTSIGNYAFSGCNGLFGELHLPEGLTSIGNYAFSTCSGFSGELRLPESLTCIGDYAFWGCSGLSGELSLPESLTSIGNYVFWECSGFKGELHLPKGLTSIGTLAFGNCSGLSGKLYLPESLTSIGDHAFRECRRLSGELRLPEGLKSIGEFAFFGCSGLKGELHLPEGLTSIGYGAFSKCNAIEKMFFYNPNIIIHGYLNRYPSCIIVGYRNSTAEEYALKQGWIFEELRM